MKLLKILIVAAIILVVAGIFLPQGYIVSRELVIKASVDEIHQRVEDMNGWERWTIWREAEPPAGNRMANMESGVG